MNILLEAHIKGAFTGWSQDKVFVLDHGFHKKWQQVDSNYQFRQIYRPKAKVLQDGAKYYLEVEGMDDMVEVKRVWN
jgi:hypothetical protein